MPLTLTGLVIDEETDVVILRYYLPDGTTADHDLVVIDAAIGAMECRWLVGELEQVGTYRGMMHLTRTVGPVVDVQKVPADGTFIVWFVYPSIPPPS